MVFAVVTDEPPPVVVGFDPVLGKLAPVAQGGSNAAGLASIMCASVFGFVIEWTDGLDVVWTVTGG